MYAFFYSGLRTKLMKHRSSYRIPFCFGRTLVKEIDGMISMGALALQH